MFSWAIVLLILEVIAPPATLSQGTEFEIKTIQKCQTISKRLAKKEGRYPMQGELRPDEPDLGGKQFMEMKLKSYNKEKRQRPFECMTDSLQTGSYETLNRLLKYQALVRQCKSKQDHPQCDPSYPYRRIDGTCNNLHNPTWGAVLSCQRRIMPAYYEGASGFRKSVCDNADLPGPRNISLILGMNMLKYTVKATSVFVYFGQFIAHDITDTPFTYVKDKKLDCCANPKSKDQHPQCAPILLERDDPFYSTRNVTCFNFIRSAVCDSCSTGPRDQMNEVTSYIDLSNTYGVMEKIAKQLRRNDGSGKLKVQVKDFGDLLPADESAIPFQCGDGNQYCFKAGDRRVNQHSVLMSISTIFMREHNRIAGVLKEMNPQWEEATLYQETRKILIAEFQVIIYKEFLPILVGHDLMTENRLWIQNHSRTTYNPRLDATQTNEFTTAAYRLHSTVDSKINLLGFETFDNSKSFLRNLYHEASVLYDDKMDYLIKELGDWAMQKYDRYLAPDVTKYLYRERKGNFGFDLTAINIQRGRDNGLPPYTEMLKYLSNGEIDIQDFDDLEPYMERENIQKLKEIYCDVRDIDLWVGMINECVLPDMVISTTAAEIIAKQFWRLKYGDRFYFEHPGHFTDEQLQTLKKASLSKMFCDNTEIELLRRNVFLFEDYYNAPHPCSDISGVDLKKWQV